MFSRPVNTFFTCLFKSSSKEVSVSGNEQNLLDGKNNFSQPIFITLMRK